MESKNIIVLGGSGFIGKNLTQKLERLGHHVTPVSRSQGVDLLDYTTVKNLFNSIQPEVAFNLASHGGSIHYVNDKAAEVFSDNVQMALNLYRAALEMCPPRAHYDGCKIINPFSNCSYPGDSTVQHEENWLDGPVHDSIFSFGNSKRSIYYLSECYKKQHGIDTVNILFPNTYGPGDSCDPNKTHALNGMIIRMLKAVEEKQPYFTIWGTGTPVREWAYVDDFVNALVRAMELENVAYPINFGQEKGYSIAESANMVKKACRFEGEIMCDDSYTDGDAVKILGRKKYDDHFSELQFFDHEAGIKETVAYYRTMI